MTSNFSKKQAIAYLIDRKFAGRVGFSRDLKTDERRFNTTNTTDEIAKFIKEETSLKNNFEAKSEQELKLLCQQERLKEKEQLPYRHLGMTDDYEHWGKADGWTPDDFAKLWANFSGVEPWVNRHWLIAEHEKILDLILRAIESGELPKFIHPPQAIAWAVKKNIHLPQALVNAIEKYNMSGGGKAESHAATHPYVTAVEAIIWIAYKKWMTYAELFEHCGQEDIFYRSQFSSMGSRDRGTDHNSYPFDIGKDEMLIFAGHLAEQKTWTEETWRKSRRGAIQDVETMQKCLDTERNKHGFTLPEFVDRLKISIAYDDEQSQKLHNATQELINAARVKKLAIRGKRKNGSGDIEDMPPGFLDRLDYKIALWGNKIIPLAKFGSHAQYINDIGWHELRVKREDVVRLWPEHPARDYFSEMLNAPAIAAAKELKARKDKAFDTLPVPDWSEWGHIPQVALWQAVALSLNVDPAALDMLGGFDPDFHGGLSDGYKRRLRVAIANQAALGIYSDMMRGHQHWPAYYLPVQVTKFFEWAAGIGWDLPVRLQNKANHQEAAQHHKEKKSPAASPQINAAHNDINNIQVQKPKGKRGMKPMNSDDSLVVKMLKKIKDDNCDSISTAADAFISEADGAGTAESKHRRLCRKFTEKYGSDLNIIRQSIESCLIQSE